MTDEEVLRFMATAWDEGWAACADETSCKHDNPYK